MSVAMFWVSGTSRAEFSPVMSPFGGLGGFPGTTTTTTTTGIRIQATGGYPMAQPYPYPGGAYYGGIGYPYANAGYPYAGGYPYGGYPYGGGAHGVVGGGYGVGPGYGYNYGYAYGPNGGYSYGSVYPMPMPYPYPSYFPFRPYMRGPYRRYRQAQFGQFAKQNYTSVNVAIPFLGAVSVNTGSSNVGSFGRMFGI